MTRLPEPDLEHYLPDAFAREMRRRRERREDVLALVALVGVLVVIALLAVGLYGGAS